MEKIIEVSGLKKSYGSLQAVKGLDFYVEKGKLFAFLGPNGAGKSTTIDILCTLGNYDDGEVTIAGYSPRKSPEEIRRRIGVVFQDSLLDKTLRVKDNLQLRAGFYYRKKAELDNAVRKAAQSAEAEAFLNRPYGKLSGGQRRRADIARALLSSPEILFLDEPTTGLDPQTRRHVWKTIRRLQREQGMTIFLTTHYMEEAEAADYSIILDNGLIAARGTPYQLKAAYSRDHLKLKCRTGQETSAAFMESLRGKGLAWTEKNGSFDIRLKDTAAALPLLRDWTPYIENFEVLHGTMDDVFLNITGKELRE